MFSHIFQIPYDSLSQKHRDEYENQRTNCQDLNIDSIEPHMSYYVEITVYLHHSYDHSVTHNYKRKIVGVHIYEVVLAVPVEELYRLTLAEAAVLKSLHHDESSL